MVPLYTARSGLPIHSAPIPDSFTPAECRNLNSIVTSMDEMKIDIDNHFSSKRYRNGSVIEGTVTIKSRRQLHVGRIVIKVVCDSSVKTNDHNLSRKTWHRLLDLDMPMPYGTIPQPQIIQPGRTYKFAFHFVLPNILATAACTHNLNSDEIRRMHLQLPPSLTGWGRGESGPRGARVEYGVIAQILGATTPQYAELESKQTFQFLPLPEFVEHPSWRISSKDQIYQFQTSQSLKRSLLSKSLGRISLSMDPPKPLVLDESGRVLPPLSAEIHVCLELLSDIQDLPQSCVVSAAVKSDTWFKDKPMQDWPHCNDRGNLYSSMETLTKKTSMSIAWKPEVSDQRTNASCTSSDAYKSSLFVPLQDLASDERLLLPTFYSCLLSRTYNLHVIVTVFRAVLRLVVPMQVEIGPTDGAASYQPSGFIDQGPNNADGLNPAPPYYV